MKDTLLNTASFEEARCQSPVRELTQVKIDRSLPVALRAQRFVAEIRDPYHFTVNGTDVRIAFTGSSGMSERLACALSATAGMNAERRSSNTGTLEPDLSESTVA